MAVGDGGGHLRPRIGLNALALRPGGSGVQTYIRELLASLPAHVDAEIVASVQRDAAEGLPPTVIPDLRRPSTGPRRAMEGLRSLGAVDLVHGLDVDLPLRPRAPTVATVHDLSVFDAAWAHPRRRAAGERILVRRSLRQADAIISVSAFTAERVASRFGRESVVIHEAPPPELGPAAPEEVASARSRYGLPELFVLHVGTVEPRKDVATLAAACRQVGVPLVLAGSVLRGSRVPPGARSIGWVPQVDLAPLYGAAAVVGYPSRYEGFGLPPLEAMACGAPVVATRVTSLPEVLGDAAELVPVGDVDALAAALRALLHDDELRAARVQAGRARAAALTWDDTAARTAAVYRGLGVPV